VKSGAGVSGGSTVRSTRTSPSPCRMRRLWNVAWSIEARREASMWKPTSTGPVNCAVVEISYARPSSLMTYPAGGTAASESNAVTVVKPAELIDGKLTITSPAAAVTFCPAGVSRTDTGDDTDEQPALELRVTKCVPSAATSIDCEVPPVGLQRYDAAGDAVRRMTAPATLCEILASGGSLTCTVWASVMVQPLAVVAVTAYVELADGATAIVRVVAPLDH
jgi:hypothetical protein